ncbi:MAG: Phosphoglycolate phosphatase (EC [uncultured Thiotrichaceae bacterium]|uniref:Phosphoglycolate phosphatase n=1 Tax=uncultured Thiotrichaceae bacterium TaxID=298394 RepID=A0A6S6UHC3_9GAMM|nr:MAG: Phosphoglycolate phosphatase (EC [uncultured Thiotrichaceae bacterium]
MKTFSPKMVLIDVDGTLVDSVPDLAWCVDEMLKRIDMQPHGEEVVRNWVGNGVVRLVERALTNDLDGFPDKALFDKAMPIFDELYSVYHSDRSELYPGVKEGLEYLHSVEGLAIGCVTNKAERFTIPILKNLGIHDDFEIIVCGDTLEKKKPDPMPLLHSAEALGAKPEESLMLGDSKSDVKAARAAGFSIICMSYGYNHGEDIRIYEPDAVIDSMTELTQLIKSTHTV